MTSWIRWMLVLAILVLSREAPAQNLIVNGNFNAGYRGFTSDYAYATRVTDVGTIAIGSDPVRFHSQGASYGDHTGGGGDMLLVNASNRPDQIVWQQTVATAPHTNYEMVCWVASWGNTDGRDPSPARLRFSINQRQVGDLFTAQEAVGQWTAFKVTWNSEKQTSATIQIVDVNTDEVGNDFSLDDIQFAPILPISLIVTPNVITGGIPVTGTFTMAGTVRTDTWGILTSSDASVATLPPSVMLRHGQSSAAFLIKTPACKAERQVTLSMTIQGRTVSSVLTVTPTRLLAVHTTTENTPDGVITTGILTLSQKAPPEGYTVQINSSDPGIATVPVSVLVSEGKMSATFPVSASAATGQRQAILTATFGGISRQTLLSVRKN